MSENAPPPQFIDKWKIVCVLGEGAFGQVYCVHEKNDKKRTYFAMKVEQKQKNRNDEVLRMEVQVMERVNGKFFCDIFHKGQTDKITFIVITLLGKPLDDIRRAQPTRRFSKPTALKIGLQMIKAFKKLHYVGYIHRDVKPANIAPGYHHSNMLYLFDFGLSRYIFRPEGPGHLRPARSKVPFRGTYRYCSINAHMCRDQGRVDDLWGLLYSLVELCAGTLPWTGMKQVESLSVKTGITDDELFVDCPRSFKKVKKRLNQYKFEDLPDYDTLVLLLFREIYSLGREKLLSEPFEWQNHPDVMNPFKQIKRSKEEEDEDTIGTVESEYDSDYGEGDGTNTITVDDNTLDDLNDENLKEQSKIWEEQKKLKKAAATSAVKMEEKKTSKEDVKIQQKPPSVEQKPLVKEVKEQKPPAKIKPLVTEQKPPAKVQKPSVKEKKQPEKGQKLSVKEKDKKPSPKGQKLSVKEKEKKPAEKGKKLSVKEQKNSPKGQKSSIKGQKSAVNEQKNSAKDQKSSSIKGQKPNVLFEGKTKGSGKSKK
uniref:Protein kinase domain-containing protein n=1 Tax=Meloidogyne incognita TaxID=6306 RepID=A0A914LLA4_MELIC